MADATSSEELFETIVSKLMAEDFAIVDDFLDESACRVLLECLVGRQKIGQFRQAGIGRGAEFAQQQTIRGDEILWLEKEDSEPVIQQFMERMESLIAYCNRTCFTGIRDMEAHFAVYSEGAYYHRHLDQFRGNGNRKFTFILYLNFDWQPSHGGCLRMYLPQGDTEIAMDIAPQAGRLVCFKSDAIPHEVLPTHALRYSITGWWLEREKQLSFLG
ncbi:MAG: 2OG-Fe(II) oxygenase [Bacteroidetes bacterium]|nr:2OG-Fe(II) oxygenase [Bacteroidota bacterium]